MSNLAVENARKLTNSVISAVEKHVIPVVQNLDAERAAKEESPLNIASIINPESLRTKLERYAGLATDLGREVGEDRQARQSRDALWQDLRVNLSSLSRAVDVSYGRETVQILRLGGSTPNTFARLVAKAQGFLDVSNPLPSLPEPSTPWFVPDIEGAREQIQTLVEKITEANQFVSTEARETQKMRVDRDEAGTLWFRELRFHVGIARTTLSYAGHHELAKRVLPTEKQIRRAEPTSREPVENDSPQNPDVPTP